MGDPGRLTVAKTAGRIALMWLAPRAALAIAGVVAFVLAIFVASGFVYAIETYSPPPGVLVVWGEHAASLVPGIVWTVANWLIAILGLVWVAALVWVLLSRLWEKAETEARRTDGPGDGRD